MKLLIPLQLLAHRESTYNLSFIGTNLRSINFKPVIDPTIKYILTQHTSFIHIYVYSSLRKRNINTQKIALKLNEVYGKHYNAEQFLEFGEKFLNDYLIQKHSVTFNDILLEAFQPIIHRFKHLA